MWGHKKGAAAQAEPPKVNVKDEIDRRRSQASRILALLQRGGYITNIDLQRIAFNYTMRVSELRKDGHKIIAIYESPGVFRYLYKGHQR